MQLSQELPDYRYALRFADGEHAKVNDRILTSSFILTPDTLDEAWPCEDARNLSLDLLRPILALDSELVILGTGARQWFLPPALSSAFLTRGIGIETMDNAAAARTYTILATERRRFTAAFILSTSLRGGA